MKKLKCISCKKTKFITSFKIKKLRGNGKQKSGKLCIECWLLENLNVSRKHNVTLDSNSDAIIEALTVKKKGKNITSYISYEKAQKLVKSSMADIVTSNLILKRYSVKEFRHLIFKRDKNKCHYCESKANTIDHVIPKSKGGISSFENCVACCDECNKLKSDFSLETFLYSYDSFNKLYQKEITQGDYSVQKIREMKQHLLQMNKHLAIHIKILQESGYPKRKHKHFKRLKKTFDKAEKLISSKF